MRRRFCFGAVVAITLTLALAAPTAHAAHFARSVKVALIPDNGSSSSGGTVQTSGTVPGQDGDSFDQFSFTDVPLDQVTSATLTNYDTVVLTQVQTADLSDTAKQALSQFVTNGGKLIIHDADGTTGNDYSWLPVPAQTGQSCSNCGATDGTSQVVESNTLVSSSAGDASYVNVGELQGGTDAVGDANVMVTQDPRWFVDIRATNSLGSSGAVHTYASDTGLIIFDGYDGDQMGSTEASGIDWLAKLWYLELAQGWDPDGLPHGTPVNDTCTGCADLGGVSLDTYCQHLGFTRSELSKPRTGPGNAYDNWVCVASDGSTTALSLQSACEFTYAQRPIKAIPTDPDDAYSWHCFQTPPPPQSCLPENPPRVVVVMVMGLNSELPAPAKNPYDPLSVSACNASTSTQNASLSQLGSTFDSRGLGSGAGPTLMTSLAQTGALILPFSYRGAYMQGTAQGPRFYVNAYGKSDPNQADIINEDWVLDNELQSIRSTWPQAKIILIGHSEGGLIVKQWWRNWDGNHGGAPDHATRSWNVDGVYTLDGPINGGSSPFESLEFTQGQNTCPILTSMLPCARLAQQFAALWYAFALNGDDTAMARADTGDRGIFTPIGTRGDLVMELLSMSSKLINVDGEELGPQLLADFDSSGQINTLIQPGRLTPTIGSASDGLDSHGIVYRDPSNIAYLTAAVVQAQLDHAKAIALLPPPRARSSLADTSPASASLVEPAVRAGGTLRIRGTGLGVTAGQLLLTAPGRSPRALRVTSWSSGAVTARAPARAQRGVVIVQTASGEMFPCGLVTVTGGPSTVRHIHLRETGGSAIDGRPLALEVTALGARTRAVPGAHIQLSDGLRAISRRADRHGRAQFQTIGFGTSTYVASSGSTWTALRITRRLPPALTLRLTHARRHRRHHLILAITVHVLNKHRRPVKGVPVKITLIRPGQRLPSPIVRTTSRNGTASLSIAAKRKGLLTLTASTNDGFTVRQLTLRGV